jgi:hypothetical protein
MVVADCNRAVAATCSAAVETRMCTVEDCCTADARQQGFTAWYTTGAVSSFYTAAVRTDVAVSYGIKSAHYSSICS